MGAYVMVLRNGCLEIVKYSIEGLMNASGCVSPRFFAANAA
jgi:hypothetical protein